MQNAPKHSFCIILSEFIQWTLNILWEERKVFQINYAQLLQGNINLTTFRIFKDFFAHA